MIFDKLIVMDDISGLADKSDEFANFLTVSRKYGLMCVHIFHTIYPSRQNWQMIMSQTQIFNFFSLDLLIVAPSLGLCLLSLTDTKASIYLHEMFG